jgi:hypothetical protein
MNLDLFQQLGKNLNNFALCFNPNLNSNDDEDEYIKQNKCYILNCGSKSGSYGCFRCNTDLKDFYEDIKTKLKSITVINDTPIPGSVNSHKIYKYSKDQSLKLINDIMENNMIIINKLIDT